jgi:hypothetical protein
MPLFFQARADCELGLEVVGRSFLFYQKNKYYEWFYQIVGGALTMAQVED